MNAATSESDVVIIGGGPAGYSAGIYAARASLKTTLIEQGMPGGQIATTDVIENYPGFASISGSEFGAKLQEHGEAAGVNSAYGVVESIELLEDGTFNVTCSDAAYHAGAVIVATGARPRQAGFEGEERFRGRGISYCATCDGMFYRNKDVFVIGGGNAACEEGLYLARIARSVTMVVRRDEFRAPRGVVDKLLADEKVTVRYLTSITSVQGDTFIHAITFRDNVSGTEHTESFDEGSVGIFVFAGTHPVTELVEPYVDLAPDGGVVTDEVMATKTPGLYCVGDMRSKRLRQVITAAADGAIAGTEAYRYLTSRP